MREPEVQIVDGAMEDMSRKFWNRMNDGRPPAQASWEVIRRYLIPLLLPTIGTVGRRRLDARSVPPPHQMRFRRVAITEPAPSVLHPRMIGQQCRVNTLPLPVSVSLSVSVAAAAAATSAERHERLHFEQRGAGVTTENLREAVSNDEHIHSVNIQHMSGSAHVTLEA